MLALVTGFGLGGGNGLVHAQQNGNGTLAKPRIPLSQQDSMPSDDIRVPEDMGGPMRARMNEERVNLLNTARHKRLEDDAEKLLALSTELKTDVDKTTRDELSVEVMRKAAEIEKLAHEVQNRMKN